LFCGPELAIPGQNKLNMCVVARAAPQVRLYIDPGRYEGNS